ncbi:cupredoxin domain-containing protein [Kitasatospora sp. NBC_00240]|uniref:cupredoxin domain-containing protein n=1 Tax=Kitasatospora sp. NBC_00240 TaxID=2903567 RepID=UPI0022545E43|nr:cupredoxin domain-containing protein [Kitasatospora sp. NBC_00240]MCX5209889.1 cupredoxin domain-containing protein [Kitasatospora sp. NBC_00240]
MLPTNPRRWRTALTAVTVLALLGLAGCSSSKPSTPSTPSPASADASPTAAGSPSPSAGSASPSAAGSGSASPSGTPAAAVTVTIKDFAFTPVAVTVAPGATVTVINQDSTAHTVTSVTDGLFDTGDIAGGQTTTFTAPTTPGEYRYICSIHPNMHGTLTVQ